MANESGKRFKLCLGPKGELEWIEWSDGLRPICRERARFAPNRIALALLLLEYKLETRAAPGRAGFKRTAGSGELYHSLGRSAFAEDGQIVALVWPHDAGAERNRELRAFFPSKYGDNLSARSETVEDVTVRIDRRRLPRQAILVFQDGEAVSAPAELTALFRQLKARWKAIPPRAPYGERTKRKIQKAMAGSGELKATGIDYLEERWRKSRIAKSLQALAKKEREAIQAISLLPGSFTLPMVQRVCGASLEAIRFLEQAQWIRPFAGVRPMTSQCRDEVRLELGDRQSDGLKRRTMMNFAAYYVEKIEYWEHEYIAGGFQRSGLPSYEAEGFNVDRALQWILERAERTGRALCLQLTYIGNYLIPIRYDAEWQKRLYSKGVELAKSDRRLFEYFRGRCALAWAFQSTGENGEALKLYPALEELGKARRDILMELQKRFSPRAAENELSDLYARATGGKAHCEVNLGRPVTACASARRALSFADEMLEGILKDRMYRNIYRVLGRAELDCGDLAASKAAFEKGLHFSGKDGRDPTGIGINQGGLGLVAITQGKPRAAVRIFEGTLRTIRSSVNSHWAETENMGRLALAWLRVGDQEGGKAAQKAYAEADRLALEAYAIAAETSEQRGMAILQLTGAEAKARLGGAPEEIREILENARARAKAIGDQRLEARAWFLMSRLRIADAEACRRQAMAIWKETGGSRPDSPEAGVSYS